MLACLMFVLAFQPTVQFPQTSGYHNISFQYQGNTYRFTLYLPDQEPPEGGFPLIIALHYGGPMTPWISRSFMENLVVDGFKDFPAIIVAPDCPGDGWSDPRAVALVKVLLDLVPNAYSVNADKRLCMGYSMGGAGVWTLLAAKPKWFQAGIVVSGQAPEAVPEKWPDVPLVVVHSLKDGLIDINGPRKAVQALKKSGHSAELIIVRDAGHFNFPRFKPSLAQAARKLGDQGFW